MRFKVLLAATCFAVLSGSAARAEGSFSGVSNLAVDTLEQIAGGDLGSWVEFSTLFEDLGSKQTKSPACPTCGIPTVTPLPAALPLYGAGLGLMGLLSWRRKRKAAAKSP